MYVVAVSAALAPNAFAATVSIVTTGPSQDHLRYDAVPGEANDIQVAQSAGVVTISDQGAVIVAGAGCTQLGDHQVSCSSVAESFDASFFLGDLNDRAKITQVVRNMSVYGEDGADILSNCPQCDASLSGGPGSDTLEGGDRSNFLFGDGGADTITGGALRDDIFGGDGADTIAGGGGGDGILPGDGDDHVDGGEGRDEIFFDGSPTPVVVDLLAGTVTGYGTKTLVGIENVEGTGHRDQLYGDHGANALHGLGGADLLVGRGGGDYLVGGLGRGADSLYGGPGPDRLEGDGGADLLIGGWGNDLLKGGRGADRLYGRAGNDTLRARDRVRDLVAGGKGSDRARIDAGLDVSRSIEAFF